MRLIVDGKHALRCGYHPCAIVLCLVLTHADELFNLIVLRIEREFEAPVVAAAAHLDVWRRPRDVGKQSEDAAEFALTDGQRGAAAVAREVEILCTKVLFGASVHQLAGAVGRHTVDQAEVITEAEYV